MKLRTVSHAALVAAGLILSACSGGGGGGGNSSPPPPPPPANAAPTARITAQTSTIDERQAITVDGSTSSDPDGDALSFVWRQTSGTDLGVNGATTPEIQVAIPDLSADFDFVLELEVSDGSLSDTATQTFTANDIQRTPLSTQWDGIYATLPAASGELLQVYGGNGTVEGASDRIDGQSLVPVYSLLKQGTSILLRRQGVLDDGSISDDDTFTIPGIVAEEGPFNILFQTLNLDTSSDIALAANGSGKIRILKSPSDANVDTFDFGAAGEFDLAGLCGLATGLVGPPPEGFQNEYPGLVAGTDGNGLIALVNAGNPREDTGGGPISDEELAARGTYTEQRTLLTAGAYCGLASAGDSGSLFAYDPQREEVVLISDLGEASATIDASVVLNVRGGGPYSLVGTASGFGVAGQPFYGVLLTDGSHHGNHDLFMVQQTSAGLTSERISLPPGVPSELVIADVDFLDAAFTDTDDDILIAVPGTPYVYVIETLSDLSSDPVDFSILLYFEAGFGVSDVSVGNVDQRLANELIVANEDGSVTIYQNSER